MLSVKMPEGFRTQLGERMNAPIFTVTTDPTTPIIHYDGTPPYPPIGPTDPDAGTNPVEEYIYFIDRCYDIRFQKDAEYKARGDNTSLFRELDRNQGAACDMANSAFVKAREMGYTVNPVDYNEFKNTMKDALVKKIPDFNALHASMRMAVAECNTIKRKKDAEYKARGDNTPRFRTLDRNQGVACDKANDEMNKLREFLRSFDINENSRGWGYLLKSNYIASTYTW